MNKYFDASYIKDIARGRWLEIFQAIAPNLEPACRIPGKHVPDPVVGGKDGFRLFKDAPDTGASYSNKEGPLKDGFSTLMYATGMRFPEVIKQVASVLGVSDEKPRQVVTPRTAQPREWQPSAKELVIRKSKLNNLWRQAITLDSPQAKRAIRYLQYRGIKKDFSHVKSFRYHPAVWYKNEAGNLCQAPAFIQMWRLPDGTPVNIHKILLSVKTNGKAELENPKLMMKPTARMTGGAIRIGKPPENGELSVATGVETALSVTEATGKVCWSTLNDGLLRGFVPPEGTRNLIIWADNDRPDAKGRNSGVIAAFTLRKRLLEERPDLKVIVKIPPIKGRDWNDMLLLDKQSFFK